MDAQELYEAIKEAISVFGLRWQDKHKIKVKLSASSVRFIYGKEEYIRRAK